MSSFFIFVLISHSRIRRYYSF